MRSVKRTFLAGLAFALAVGSLLPQVRAQSPAATVSGPHGEGGKIVHMNGENYITYSYVDAPGKPGVPVAIKVFRPRLDPPAGLPKPNPPAGDGGSWVFIGEGNLAQFSALIDLDASGLVTWTTMSPDTLAKYRPPMGAAQTAAASAGSAAPSQGSNAAQQSPDPNLPYYRGTLSLPPNPAGAYLLGYEWRDFRSTPRIYFNSMPGHRPHNAWYLGYNSEGTWLQDETTLNIYILKGMDFSLSPIRAAADIRGLKNTPASWVQAPGAQDSNATAVAQQTVDPNLPAYKGEFKPDPNPEGAVLITYAWRDRKVPDIQVYMNTGEAHEMFYIGYNDQGAWMQDTRTGRMFLLKGKTVSLAPVQTMEAMPNGLKNAVNSYLDLHQGAKQAATTPSAEPEHPDAVARAATPAQSLGAVPPGTAGGSQAKIERGASGITLTYTDASGKHSYRVRRPAIAVSGATSQQFNAIDTGGWLYVAPGGNSGILFNVTDTGAVTAIPMPAQALMMLTGHRPN